MNQNHQVKLNFRILIKVGLHSWRGNSDVIQYHYVLGCFKTSQTYLDKDVSPTTSLTRIKKISCKYFYLSMNTQKVVSCNFCKVIEIFDKIDVGPLKTLKK